MRRGQAKPFKKNIPNRRRSSRLSDMAQTIVYGCDPAPVATLGRKYVRILKRLLTGKERLVKVDGCWQWYKEIGKPGGKVKNALLDGLRALGLAVCIGGRWSATSKGLQAVS